MALIDTQSQDALLTDVRTNSNKLILCSSAPATYAAAVSAQLAEKSSPSFGAIGAYAGGRRFEISAITDGSGTATGTATDWALIDTANSRLKATKALASSVAIASGATIKIAGGNYVNALNAV